MDITLLIPTLNRPDLLIRELRYYQSMNFGGKILIGDSSNAPTAKVITDSLSQFANSLEIHYRYLPSCSDARVLQTLAEEATTSYVAFIADDDFLVPAGIARCVDFLDGHSDYVAAHGVGVNIGSHSGNAGVVDYAGYYQQSIVEGATAAQRLNAHLAHYTVSLFSVHRIDVWRAMFKDAPRLADKSFGSELLPCCLSVVGGKIKQLDGLYLIRQDHHKRYLLPGWYEWMTNEAWYPSYVTFRECLAEAIVRQDGMSLDEARQTVDQSFSFYLARVISGPSPKISMWRQVAKRIPGARKVRRALQVLRAGMSADIMSLRALLNPSSPYYAAFMPVHNAVTQPPMVTS